MMWMSADGAHVRESKWATKMDVETSPLQCMTLAKLAPLA